MSRAAHVRMAFLALALAAPAGLEARPRADHAATVAPDLHFEPNAGQADDDVLFVARGSSQAILVGRSGIVLRSFASDEQVTLALVAARQDVLVTGESLLPGTTSYFLGRDPSRWITGLPHYARVVVHEPWPGIDMILRSAGDALEYDFVAVPGADLSRIRLALDGVDHVELAEDGSLLACSGTMRIAQGVPVAWQEIGSERTMLPGRFVVRGRNEIGFDVGRPSLDGLVVIDPVLTFTTFIGGRQADYGDGLVVDADGNSYLAGTTYGGLRARHAVQRRFGGDRDAFAVKLSPDGRTTLYATYLGGELDDSFASIAVTPDGSAIVVGGTNSPDFPVQAALDGTHGGLHDAFVAKLSPQGSQLLYSTYLGGSDWDTAWGVASDAAGRAVVSGETRSPDFPTASAYQPLHQGGGDAFVAVLDAAGSSLDYSTYLGGSGFERPFGIAMDAAGQAVIVGMTQSPDFDVVSAFQPVFGGGDRDAFITKLAADGGSLVYSTFAGGSGGESLIGVAVDAAGAAFAVGGSNSVNYPVLAALQPARSGPQDAVVTKLSAAGALVFSTYFGGSGEDSASDVALAADGDILFAGQTSSSNLPLVGAIDTSRVGLHDALVARLSSTGAVLEFSSYVGGDGGEGATGCGLDAAGNMYVGGWTDSPSGFPVDDPRKDKVKGDADAFVVKIAP